ncbi:MAG TPA: glycosyltransferase family 4 protein [Candidatus Angelobacter sp.]|nr:glycosyltransferase family 4 protein [Candidatus Angelobacter sp.]
MSTTRKPIRVLYSFPHKLGADRICYTAWQQVNGLAAAGAEVLAFPGVLHRPVPPSVRVRPTLARGKFRIPYKLLGTMRALALHDHIVARRLEKLAGQVDIVHAWPDAAQHTLDVAKKLGIPTVLERPNAHTRYAYEAVQCESRRLGITLPPNNEYAFKTDVLAREEREYRAADGLLCPSDFVVRTFLDQGFPAEKLVRHQYGYDEKTYYPALGHREEGKRGLTMLFAGDCAVRKGLHFALEAWLASPAHREGTFMIAGNFLPSYAEKLSSMLSHPSVHVLGFRRDVPELMRQSDVFVLPSIEEGSALVTSDARGSGCVLLVSEAAGAICKHLENALVHPIGNVKALTEHIALLHKDRSLLRQLRMASLRTVHEITWTAAGQRLLQVYREVVEAKRAGTQSAHAEVVR